MPTAHHNFDKRLIGWVRVEPTQGVGEYSEKRWAKPPIGDPRDQKTADDHDLREG